MQWISLTDLAQLNTIKNDENYNVSFLSNVFVKFTKMSRQHPELVKHPESLETLKTLIEFQGVKLAESEGGSSGAGGGGDIRSQQFKEAVLEELFFDFDRNQISEMQFILATDILSLLKVELSPVVPNGQFTFENKTRTLLIPKEVLSNENLDLNYLKIVIPVSKAIVSVVSK